MILTDSMMGLLKAANCTFSAYPYDNTYQLFDLDFEEELEFEAIEAGVDKALKYLTKK